jgi:hypothetical protein
VYSFEYGGADYENSDGGNDMYGSGNYLLYSVAPNDRDIPRNSDADDEGPGIFIAADSY